MTNNELLANRDATSALVEKIDRERIALGEIASSAADLERIAHLDKAWRKAEAAAILAQRALDRA